VRWRNLLDPNLNLEPNPSIAGGSREAPPPRSPAPSGGGRGMGRIGSMAGAVDGLGPDLGLAFTRRREAAV